VNGILRIPRRIALAVITVVLAAASAMSLGASYRGLYLWAHRHGLAGFWAAGWPLMVDTFLVVGELALFVALVDRWPARARTPAWAITLAGLAVSVAGNVGHVAGHDVLVRATAAVPPLAAAAALAVGLGVLKRVVELHAKTASEPVPKTTVKPAAKTQEQGRQPGHRGGCPQGHRGDQPGPAGAFSAGAGTRPSHRPGQGRPGPRGCAGLSSRSRR
jgi:Protein of unknown function (DUF2637)